VTGASSGIGAACAEVLAARGCDLILTARRKERLHALAASLHDRYGCRVEVIPADLVDPDGVARLCDEIAGRGLAVDVLVNNAGFGVKGSYARTTWEQQSALLQVLVVALAELTHRLLPGMVERRFGRVLNVSSLAGLLPAPGGHTLYAAAKALVIRFSESLAHEVQPFNIHVTALCPGFTHSEFHDVAGTRDKVRTLPGFMWMDAMSVARAGVDAVMAGKLICVPGRVSWLLAIAGRHLPFAWAYALQKRFAWSYRNR
jgi:short-subunit dehydrogenase